MPEQSLFTPEQAKKMAEEIAVKVAQKAGLEIAAMTLEQFAHTILDAKINATTADARIGAELMCREVAKIALATTNSFREQAAKRGVTKMADQPKTKEERRDELRRLMTTPDGQKKVVELFRKACGVPAGTMPPIGAPVIHTILDKEYPNG
jgi:hypothetical protein